MGMEGLGRLFNAIQPADDVYVSLENASGVTFIGFEVDGESQFQITTAENAGGDGSSTTGTLVDHYYGRSNDQAAGVWHRTAVSPAASLVVAADVTEDQVAIFVSADMLPDGHKYVKCTADGSGVVMAILHDLTVQRDPANLSSVTA